MRKKIIAGNWKMNKTPAEAKALCELLKDKVNTTDADVVFCVPFVDLYPVLEALQGTNIAVGAENMHFEESGAYTGEISAAMLKEMGVKYVVIGHSERRQYFAETDETVNKKVKKHWKVVCCPSCAVAKHWSREKQTLPSNGYACRSNAVWQVSAQMM